MKEDLDNMIKDLEVKSNILKEDLLLNQKMKIDVEKSKDFIKIYYFNEIISR